MGKFPKFTKSAQNFGKFSIIFFFVGGVVGWLAKEHFYNTQPVYTHPEMFDENGNIIPDEILAVRFEHDYDDEEISDD